MKTIHDLTKRVEEAHIRHLKEVKSLEEQTRNVSAASSPQPAATIATTDTNVSFESLVGGNVKNTDNGNDMFGSMLTPTNNTLKPQQPSWSNQPITPTTSTSNTLSSPQKQNQPLNWNSSQKPMTPMSSSNNGMANMNLNNYSQNNSGWSPSLQNAKPITQQIPSLTSPPSFQNTPINSNYNALKGLTSNVTPHKQKPMMPSTMSLLQPTSTSTNLTNNTPKLTKPNNLHAFDPLG